VAETIRPLSTEEGYPLSEMAVIYAMKTPENDPAMNLPLLIGKALDKKGLLHNWISEGYRSKRSYDVTTESVTISTIHNVKGFDYACVFLLGLDWMAPGRCGRRSRSAGWPMSRSPGRGKGCLFPIAPGTNLSADF
jgi:hypothetical protein